MSRWNATGVTQRLGIDYPIIQGPFGGGGSTPALAAAVSNAGGLGSFGALASAPDEIGTIARDIRALTSKPFAINLWVSTYDAAALTADRDAYARAADALRPFFDEVGAVPPDFPTGVGLAFEDQARAVIDAAPAVFSFIVGVPSRAILNECRRKGIVTLGTATTPAEAVALETAGVDLIVASGFEAGGHRGSFLAAAEQSLTGTFALVPQVADAVRVPVIAAGGIGDARGIVAALTLGAQGVQMGTAFLACDESGASPLHRAALFGDLGRQTGLTTKFTGRLARGIRNRLMDEMAGDRFVAMPYPIQRGLMRPLAVAAGALGRTDLMTLWAGQAAHLVRHRTVATLMATLVADADRLTRAR